jgi:hypothetical protein
MPKSAYLATGGIKLQAVDDVSAPMTLGAKKWLSIVRARQSVETGC